MSKLKTSLPRKGVFAGNDSLKDYLDPENHPYLPLIELPASLNPYNFQGVRIFVKMMSFLPLGNVKSLPAYNMLETMSQEGELKGKDTIVESSSGNTVASLAVTGRQFGLETTRALVSSEVTPGKLRLLRLLGVEVIVNDEPICPDPADPDSGIHQARRLAQERSTWVNPAQYDNEANPASHQRWTGPQIWDQTDGAVTVFGAGLGTTGSLLGVAKYLKAKNPAIQIVGVSRQPNNPVPGVRTTNLLDEVAFDWRGHLDQLVEISSHTSFEWSLRLCRQGILVGPSAGFAYAGLLEDLARRDREGVLEELKNDQGEIIAVFLAPDGPLPYLDEYFEQLEETYFPPVHNAELLRESGEVPRFKAVASDLDLSLEEVVARVYDRAATDLPTNDEEAKLSAKVRLIDVRSDLEYEDHHLPGSESIELASLTAYPENYLSANDSRELIFICARGNRSRTAANLARQLGFTAYSLSGGTAEWSSRQFPRVTPQSCKPKLRSK